MIVVTKYTVRFLNIFVFVGLVLFHKFRRLRCFYAFLQRSSSMTHSNEAFKICLRLRLVKMPPALRGAEPSLGHNSESYSLFSFSTKSKLEFGLLIVTAAGSARLVLKQKQNACCRVFVMGHFVYDTQCKNGIKRHVVKKNKSTSVSVLYVTRLRN